MGAHDRWGMFPGVSPVPCGLCGSTCVRCIRRLLLRSRYGSGCGGFWSVPGGLVGFSSGSTGGFLRKLRQPSREDPPVHSMVILLKQSLKASRREAIVHTLLYASLTASPPQGRQGLSLCDSLCDGGSFQLPSRFRGLRGACGARRHICSVLFRWAGWPLFGFGVTLGGGLAGHTEDPGI